MRPETQEEVGPFPTVRMFGMVDILEDPAGSISEMMDMLEDPGLSHTVAVRLSEMMDMLEDFGLSHADSTNAACYNQPWRDL